LGVARRPGSFRATRPIGEVGAQFPGVFGRLDEAAEIHELEQTLHHVPHA
jgi:hypothetical protein